MPGGPTNSTPFGSLPPRRVNFLGFCKNSTTSTTSSLASSRPATSRKVSFWSPMDPVQEATLRCVAGSHRWEKPVLPTRWLSNEDFYAGEDRYMPVPDPDAEGMPILEWDMEPGDAVAFNYRTLHGARGNTAAARCTSPRRRPKARAGSHIEICL